METGLKQFAKDVKTVTQFTNGNSLAILNNIKIDVADGKYCLSATNLDAFISVNGECQCIDGEKYSILVYAKLLSAILAQLSGDNVSVVFTDGNVCISADGFTGDIPAIPPDDFPAAPQDEYTQIMSVPADEFCPALEIASIAVAKDICREVLTGIYMHAGADGKTQIVATDGHRLSLQIIDTGCGGKTKIIFPQAAIRIAKCIDPESQLAISTSTDGKYVLIEAGMVTAQIKTISGPYPDYNKVLPKKASLTADVDSKLLYSAIKRSTVFSSEKTHLVKMAVGADGIDISAANADIGCSASQKIPATCTGEINIGVNAEYFCELLQHAGEMVTLEIGSATSAVVFRCPDALYLIMPLRISADE